MLTSGRAQLGGVNTANWGVTGKEAADHEAVVLLEQKEDISQPEMSWMQVLPMGLVQERGCAPEAGQSW